MPATTFTEMDRCELAHRAFWGMLPALSDFIRVRLSVDGMPIRLTLVDCVRTVGVMPDGEIDAALSIEDRLNAVAA